MPDPPFASVQNSVPRRPPEGAGWSGVLNPGGRRTVPAELETSAYSLGARLAVGSALNHSVGSNRPTVIISLRSEAREIGLSGSTTSRHS